MDKYYQRAVEQIILDLNFTLEQLDLIGKILSLEDNDDLVRFVELSRYGDLLDDKGGEFMYIKSPRKVHARVILQNHLYNQPHEMVEEKVRKALNGRSIDTTNFFSYCSHSYGIENLMGIDVLIGGTPLRTDEKLHTRDSVKLFS